MNAYFGTQQIELTAALTYAACAVIPQVLKGHGKYESKAVTTRHALSWVDTSAIIMARRYGAHDHPKLLMVGENGINEAISTTPLSLLQQTYTDATGHAWPAYQSITEAEERLGKQMIDGHDTTADNLIIDGASDEKVQLAERITQNALNVLQHTAYSALVAPLTLNFTPR